MNRNAVDAELVYARSFRLFGDQLVATGFDPYAPAPELVREALVNLALDARDRAIGYGSDAESGATVFMNREVFSRAGETIVMVASSPRDVAELAIRAFDRDRDGFIWLAIRASLASLVAQQYEGEEFVPLRYETDPNKLWTYESLNSQLMHLPDI